MTFTTLALSSPRAAHPRTPAPLESNSGPERTNSEHRTGPGPIQALSLGRIEIATR